MFRKPNTSSILGSMRAAGYAEAAAAMQRKLQPELKGSTINEFYEVAIHAMNACRPYIKTGKMRLVYAGRRPVIQIVTRQGVAEPNSIQQLLMWCTPESVMSYLSLSGVAQLINTDENPF